MPHPSHPRRPKLVAAALLACLYPAAARAADKPSAPAEPKIWKQTPDEAQVVAATFVGGKGNEWLVSGGFQPDGTVVLAGNVAGPVLELPVPVQVVGADLPAPPRPSR